MMRPVTIDIRGITKTLVALTTTNQKTRHVGLMLVWCWGSVADGGATLRQQLVNVLCFQGRLRSQHQIRYIDTILS